MYQQLIQDFWRDHRLLLIVYVLITAAILPLESIGFSSYTSRIIGYAKSQGPLQYKKIYHCILMIAGVYLLTRGMNTIEYYLEILIDSHLVKSVRSRMFKTYLEQYKTNYTEIEPGKIASYFSVIPHMYQDVIYRFLSRVLPYTVSIIAVIAYFYYVDLRLGLTFTGMLFILAFILSITLKTCVERNLEKQRRFHDNNENITDRMSNLFSILANNQDHSEIETNQEREESFRKHAFKADIGYLRVESIINVVLFITVIIILILYLHLFRTRRKSTIVLASFLVVFHLIGYVDRIKWHFIDLVNKIGIIKNYEETSFTPNITSESDIGRGVVRDFIDRGDIKMKNIGFSYGNKMIHDNLNLEFAPNKIHLIKGHSGRGKTTIIKLLMGFIQSVMETLP